MGKTSGTVPNSFLKMYLVTGATGFIGKRVVDYLRSKNEHFRIVSRQKLKSKDSVVCDLFQKQIPDSILQGVDVVIHLAGYTHDTQNKSKVEHLYRTINVNATVQLAELAAQHGVKRFIFVSSVKAGGFAIAGQCMTENKQGKPEGVYGKTKREAELRLLEIGRQSRMHIAIVRPSLVYGPGVKGNLRLMLSGIEKGWFPPLPEVGNRRSLIHVDDLVRVLLLVANDERANGEIYIATDGQPYSSRDIYESMCQMLGKPIPKWSVPKVFFDIAALMHPRVRNKIDKLLGDECYSSEKLQALGFRAERTLKDWT